MSASSRSGLLWVAALAFLVLFSYGLSRSAIDSLLLDRHGKEAMKYAYGLVALGVTIVVPLYSRAAARVPIGTLMGLCAFATAIGLILIALARLAQVPYATYALYIWKDVYVVVLVELIWTLANSAFQNNTAKWAYGFFCVAGTFGDMSGSFLSGRLAHSIGSEQLLWLVVPTMALIAWVGHAAAKACGWPQPSGKSAMHGVFDVVKNSRPIQLLLALVATIQVATTLIDYQYRAIALHAYPLLDDRTEAFTQVDMAISSGSLVLQLLSGAIVTILGIRLLIIVLPILVGAAALYASIHPGFFGIAVLKVVNKSLDYSLFRTSKELLYRPMSYAERTQGKAAVDVFGYRVAKGGASGLLVALSGAIALVSVATAAGIGLWLLLALLLAVRMDKE